MAQPSSTKRGTALEDRIFSFFKDELDAGRFFARAECCKLRKKPRYFSRDRASEIEFDLSIELFMPDTTELFSVVLIECKNYNHAVPVDDAEEFFTKIQQVAAARAKGVIASTASFQSGAREFSKSKGIGLLRYFNKSDCKWELLRSPTLGGNVDTRDDEGEVAAGLSQQDFQSQAFDFYLQSPTRDTHSVWGFLEDLLLDDSLSPTQLRRIRNPKSRVGDLVPFVEKEALEEIAAAALDSVS